MRLVFSAVPLRPQRARLGRYQTEIETRRHACAAVAATTAAAAEAAAAAAFASSLSSEAPLLSSLPKEAPLMPAKADPPLAASAEGERAMQEVSLMSRVGAGPPSSPVS